MTPSNVLICICVPFSSFVFADLVSVCAYNTNGPPPLPVSKGSGPLNVLCVSLLYIAKCLGRGSFRCVHCKLVVRFCLCNIGFGGLKHVVDAALHSFVCLHVGHRSVLLVLLLKRLELSHFSICLLVRHCVLCLCLRFTHLKIDFCCLSYIDIFIFSCFGCAFNVTFFCSCGFLSHIVTVPLVQIVRSHSRYEQITESMPRRVTSLNLLFV